jgi:hypothetical protein
VARTSSSAAGRIGRPHCRRTSGLATLIETTQPIDGEGICGKR